MVEMYWSTAHLLYIWEMWHELNKRKIHQGGCNLKKYREEEVVLEAPCSREPGKVKFGLMSRT